MNVLLYHSVKCQTRDDVICTDKISFCIIIADVDTWEEHFWCKIELMIYLFSFMSYLGRNILLHYHKSSHTNEVKILDTTGKPFSGNPVSEFDS